MRLMQDVSWSLFALLVLTLSATAAEQPAQKPKEAFRVYPGKTFVILDGSVDLESSKDWVAVQYPFFGAVSLSGGKPQYNDVRDLTEIVWTRKEAVKKQEAKQSDHRDSKPAASPQ